MTNRTLMQFFAWNQPEDGAHWGKVQAQAFELAMAGITDVWLPPAYKGFCGIHDAGYGVYDLYDLGEFNQKGSVPTKYGTRREYLAAIEECHRSGLKVYGDLILGHRMGADEVEQVTATRKNPRTEQLQETGTIGAWSRFTFPGRNGKYSDFIWDSSHFLGVDWDENTGTKAFYQFPDKDFSPVINHDARELDSFMGADVDLDQKEVVRELKRLGAWYVDLTDLDGFRIANIKQRDADFYYNWLSFQRKRSGKELFTIGDYWSADVKDLHRFLEHSEGCMSLMDVPLYYHMVDISHHGNRYDMGHVLENCLAMEDGDHAITYVGGNDGAPGWSEETLVAEWFRPIAYALILLMEKGMPCVFYGDYYGIESQNKPAVEELPRLLKLRREYAYGSQRDFVVEKHLAGFVRTGDMEHPNSGLAVVGSVGAAGNCKMYMGKRFAGCEFVDYLGKMKQKVTIDAEGYGIFATADESVSVWIRGSRVNE